MIGFIRITVLALACSLLWGCSGGDSGKTCVPGNLVSCPCPQGGEGTQLCNDTGTFDPCDCIVEDVVDTEDHGSADTGSTDTGSTDTYDVYDAMDTSDTSVSDAEETIDSAPEDVSDMGSPDQTGADVPPVDNVSASPSAMVFPAQTGAVSEGRTLQIELADGPMGYTVETSEDWLQVHESTGMAPTSVTVSIDATTLDTGLHMAQLTITAEDTSTTEVTIQAHVLSSWTSAGGPGVGAVNAVVRDSIDPDRIYLATYGGVFRSLDGGLTWQLTSSGMFYDIVRSLAVDPSTNTLFAGTNGGMFISTDGADSWTHSNTGIDDVTTWDGIRSIHINGDRIYAGSSDIYRSTDGGASWESLNSNLNAQTILELDGGSTILVGTHANGIFRSTNGGNTFAQVYPASGGIPAPSDVGSFVYDDDTDTILATDYSFFMGGANIIKSTNGGASWSLLNSNATSDIHQLVADPVNSAILYAAADQTSFGLGQEALLKSTNGGLTWTPTALVEQTSVRAISIHPDNTDSLLVVGDGAWRTEDAGATVEESNQGLVASSISALATVPFGGDLFAGTVNQCLFRRSGDEWSASSSGLDCPTIISDVAVDPTDPLRVFVAAGGKLYLSQNGGSTFGVHGLEALSPFRILINPQDTSQIYAACSMNGIFQSMNGGASWLDISATLPPLVMDADICEAVPSTLYVGINDGAHLYKSEDSGQTWTAAGSGLPFIVTKVAVSPINPDHVVVLSKDAGIFWTLDGGESWQLASNGPATLEVRAIRFEPGSGSRIYMATEEGLYVSLEVGDDWHQLSFGLSPTFLRSIAIDPNGSAIYAGTVGGGVYQATW